MEGRRRAVRAIRAEGPVLAGLLVLIALLSGMVAAAPPLLDRAEGRVLKARIEAAQQDDAALRFGTVFKQNAGPPLAPSDLDRAGGTLSTDRPPELKGQLHTASTRVDVPETHTTTGRGPALLHLLYADDAPKAAAYVSGRPPRATRLGAPVEIAVSTHTRNALHLQLGGRVPLQGGPSRITGSAVVTGVFRTPAADDPARIWREQPLLARPMEAGSPPQAQALIAAGSLPELMDGGLTWVPVDWRVRMRLTDAQAATYAGDDGRAALVRDLARYQQLAEEHFCETCTSGGAFGMRTLEATDELRPLVKELGGEWSQAALLVSLALASLTAVGLATVLITAKLAVHRRVAQDRLRRARGASAIGLAAQRGLSTLPVAVGGLAAGLLTARTAVPTPAPLPAAAVAAAAWLALPLLTWAAVRDRALRRAEHLSPARRRATLEAAVLLLTVAGIAALRLRGTGAGLDPQLAAVPVLAGLAVVIVLIRLYPLPVRALTRLAGRGRGVVPLIALGRAGKDAPGKAMALVVLVTTLSAAVFTGLVSATVAEGRRTALDWTTGGADAVVSEILQPHAADPLRRAPGVKQAVDLARHGADLTSTATGIAAPGADLVSLDAAALLAARPGSAAGRALHAARLPAPSESKRGQPVEIPVLTSSDGMQVGDRFETDLKGASVTVRVVGALGKNALEDPVFGPFLKGRQTEPGTAPMLLTDTRILAAAERAGMEASDERVLLLFGSGLDADRTRVLAAQSGLATHRKALFFRAEEAAARGAGDMLGPAAQATTWCGVASAVLALIALLLELMLSAPERGRTLAQLRLLGLGGRSAAAVGALQLAPMALAAMAGGTALGLALPAVLGPALDLRRLTGGPVEPALHTDYLLTTALGLGLLALVACAVAVESAAGRRRGVGATLRLGDDT